MIKNKKIILGLLIVIIIYSLFIIHLTVQNHQENEKILGKSTSNNVDVSLSIGEYRFTLFGYTSPFALVTFSGLGIFDQTYADKNGYFIFKNRFSPFSPREACLTTQDQLGRLSSPLCLPPFPTNYNVKIGPVIMPPTLSLDKNNYWVGDEVILSGQTVPNSQVNLSMFTKQPTSANLLTSNNLNQSLPISIRDILRSIEINEDKLLSRLNFNFITTVEAFSFPKLETIADDKGNFSIALPSSSAQTFRFFAQTHYLENPSPESRKLTVKILPWWMIIIRFFLMLFEVIKSRLLEFIVLLEIIALLIYFLRRYFHPRTLAIVKRENQSLVKA